MNEDQEGRSIAKKIAALISKASEDILRDISRFDNHGGGGVTYEQACEMHFLALKDLIEKYNCRANWREHHWYPMEAIELRAFVPETGDSRSFALAILFLLLDDLEGGERGYMDERSSERFLKKYKALPNEYSQVILDGLRILQEA